MFKLDLLEQISFMERSVFMAGEGKINIEIVYCVASSYHAAVIAFMSEFYEVAGNSAAIKVTPGTGGVFQVFLDGDMIYDKAVEGGKYTDLPRMSEIKVRIKDKLAAIGAQ
jgi:selT/selW/selH-like putative selenoprotein